MPDIADVTYSKRTDLRGGKIVNACGTESAPMRVVEQIGDWRSEAVAVDRSSGLVRNVALAGMESKNGHRYSESALRKAVSLYADKPVFLDHAANSSRPQDRSTRDLVGNIVNPRFANGRIRGEIKTLGTEAGQTFLSLAENAGSTVGMSHVVLVTRSSDGSVVEEIHEVVSVDVVAFPATTSSLQEQSVDHDDRLPEFGSFESVIRQIDAQLPRRVRELTGDADAVCERVAVYPTHVVLRMNSADAEADGEEHSIGWRMRNQRVHLAKTWLPVSERFDESEHWERTYSHWEEAREGSEAREAEELRERLREVEATNAELQQRCEKLTAERELAECRSTVASMLEASGLPAEAISEEFHRQMLVAENDADRESLLKDREAFFELCSARVPTSRQRAECDEGLTSEETLLRLLRRGTASNR